MAILLTPTGCFNNKGWYHFRTNQAAAIGDTFRIDDQLFRVVQIKRHYGKAKPVSVEREASREEQHARYIDCGPSAWDDIGESPDY